MYSFQIFGNVLASCSLGSISGSQPGQSDQRSERAGAYDARFFTPNLKRGDHPQFRHQGVDG